MKTDHHFFFQNAVDMNDVPDESVGLVVTSPPYPMIAMWDEMFCSQNAEIAEALKNNRRLEAFELMNGELDRVWDETARVLIPGGFACINIGDATRSVNGHFMLYPNHSRIMSYMLKIGFTPLPEILWRKPSNAPNKFMGSGMLPAGAYVTQEHEYILIFRKGEKREFKTEQEKMARRDSAFFWEERNNLFSDIWTDLPGTRQKVANKQSRNRSAAFPFELPYRLINMYSVKHDIVLDPFGGLGTTMLAAMTAGRNSICYEISDTFRESVTSGAETLLTFAGEHINHRLANHVAFVHDRIAAGKQIKHFNHHYNFPVITAQERDLVLNEPVAVETTGDLSFEVRYSETAQSGFGSDQNSTESQTETLQAATSGRKKAVQLSLFD